MGSEVLTWGCALEWQQPGPAQPPWKAGPWRSQSRPPLSRLPEPPAASSPDQRQTSVHSSSVCLCERDRRVQGEQTDADVPASPPPISPLGRLHCEPFASAHALWISMTFSSVATALTLGFCCKTASSKGCSWQRKKSRVSMGRGAMLSSPTLSIQPDIPVLASTAFLEEALVRKPFLASYSQI